MEILSLGLEPETAGWKVQTNILSYGFRDLHILPYSFPSHFFFALILLNLTIFACFIFLKLSS